MSAEGYSKYRDELKPSGSLVFETDLVHAEAKEGQPTFGVPATRIAESLGRKIVLNAVMLGFFAAATELTTRENLRDAVEHSVPHGTEELNLKAYDTGWDYFVDKYGSKKTGKKEAVKAEAE